ncbi:MAG: hypothetical protein NVV63_11665 [Opitutus sp.]|nr:hypothetical protein [Opitutus sp.]
MIEVNGPANHSGMLAGRGCMDIPLILRVVGLAVLVLVILIAGAYALWSGVIQADIGRLRAQAKAPSGSVITVERIAALPAPAVRYFTRAGVIGAAIPRLVRLSQAGRIRSGAEASWMDLTAEELYSTNLPAFIWRAGMPSLTLPVVLGRDAYLEGEGSIVMKLLALLPVADERGDELRAAGLMRYLNEMLWFPPPIWATTSRSSPIDADSLVSRSPTAGSQPKPPLSSTRTVARPTSAPSATIRRRAAWKSWETPISATGPLAGLELPTHGAADWKLAGGDLRYIELEVTAVSYDD